MPTKKRQYATREAVLGAHDLPSEDVWVPEWNALVRIQCMSAMERDEYDASVEYDEDGQPDLIGIRAKLVAITARDPETGARIFKPEDVPALGRKSSVALDRLWKVSRRLSALDQIHVEELLGNLNGAQHVSSDSDSPPSAESSE